MRRAVPEIRPSGQAQELARHCYTSGQPYLPAPASLLHSGHLPAGVARLTDARGIALHGPNRRFAALGEDNRLRVHS